MFIHASPAMRRIAESAAQIAAVDVPVLCLGESGTGKEVIARLIHENSRRAGKIFLKVNCAAIPADLLESELFGYEAGAFTGAVGSKPGKFELCHKGTIFLDEIGELPARLQAKLLHVLQDGEFSRLGGRSTIRVDVRVIAATNIDMEAALESSRFREDLYYRLGAFTLELPPLRERPEDIQALLEHYIDWYATALNIEPLAPTPSFVDSCLRYAWPGNVRELENVVKRYLILRDERAALSTHRSAPRPVAVLKPVESGSEDLKDTVRTLKRQTEAEAIRNALRETCWNRKQAARMLKVSYKALLYKIRQYELDITPSRRPLPEVAAADVMPLQRAVAR